MRHSNENKKKEKFYLPVEFATVSHSNPKRTSWKFVKKKYTTYFPSFETTESHLFYLILSIIFSITFLDKRLENLLYRSVFFFSYL